MLSYYRDLTKPLLRIFKPIPEDSNVKVIMSYSVNSSPEINYVMQTAIVAILWNYFIMSFCS